MEISVSLVTQQCIMLKKCYFGKTVAFFAFVFVLSGTSMLYIVNDVANNYYLSSVRLHSSHMSIFVY